MGSNNKCTDFEVGETVYYVPKHLHPNEGESPLYKNCEEGKVVNIRYPFVSVRYIRHITHKFEYQNVAKPTHPNDLWK